MSASPPSWTSPQSFCSLAGLSPLQLAWLGVDRSPNAAALRIRCGVRGVGTRYYVLTELVYASLLVFPAREGRARCARTLSICYFSRTWVFLTSLLTWNCVRCAYAGCLCSPSWAGCAFEGGATLRSRCQAGEGLRGAFLCLSPTALCLWGRGLPCGSSPRASFLFPKCDEILLTSRPFWEDEPYSSVQSLITNLRSFSLLSKRCGFLGKKSQRNLEVFGSTVFCILISLLFKSRFGWLLLIKTTYKRN